MAETVEMGQAPTEKYFIKKRKKEREQDEISRDTDNRMRTIYLPPPID